ncbi:MAG: Gfo/Idh/MocA family oxidoreductase [Eubacteriales bacterium]
MKQIKRCAVIGCGSIAPLHCQGILDAQRELVALCDIRPKNAEKLGQKFAPEATLYTDYRQVLADPAIDAVHICTPHYLHAEMAISALAAGKHVFLEKPLAVSEEEMALIRQAESTSAGRLCVCFQNRFNDGTLAMAELLDQHGGAAYARAMLTWRRTAEYYQTSPWRGRMATEGGGVMINQAIHSLDLLLQLCGRPVGVSATTANHALRGVVTVEDTCEARITFEEGAVGLFYATTSYLTDAPLFLELVCRDGTVLTLLGERLQCNGEAVPVADTATSQKIGKACWGNGHGRLISLFYDAVEHELPMPVSAASAAEAVSVLLACYRSEGQEILLK